MRKLRRFIRTYDAGWQRMRGQIEIDLANFFKVSDSKAAQLRVALVKAGYFKPTCLGIREHHRRNATDTGWETFETKERRFQLTERAEDLRHTTAYKRIPRAQAEAIVEQFLEKVKAINADDYYLYRVREVLLFGSAATDAPDCGDVDIAMMIEARPNRTKDESTEESIKRCKAARPKTYNPFIEQIYWGEREVERALKSVSRHISLVTEYGWSEHFMPDEPRRVLYRAEQT